ncbi:MAG: choice-of-anchor Q domain-containing protein [Kiritimatiellae bacterium]|nr:choice-of-anchor Q domain-containing protein [Kiritimatiellia bacterium]
MKSDPINNYEARISNVTIANNRSKHSGGGLTLMGDCGTNLIFNSVVYGNVTTNAGDNTDDVYNETASNSNAYHHCCTSVALAPNQGNIVADPLFVDSAAGNFHLKSSSPCVDAGINLDGITTMVDLDGKPRVRYGTVDMGAYECVKLLGTVVTLR